jgi:hypothetical protein
MTVYVAGMYDYDNVYLVGVFATVGAAASGCRADAEKHHEGSGHRIGEPVVKEHDDGYWFVGVPVEGATHTWTVDYQVERFTVRA